MSASINETYSIQNEDQLLALMSKLRTIDESLTTDMDEFFQKETLKLEKNEVNLDLAKTELLMSLSSSSSLMKILSDSSFLANKLTYRVKLLDYERARVSKTKEYVQQIIMLKKCISRIHEALEIKDWATVSSSMSTILHEIPASLLTDSKYANIMIPTSEIPETPEKLVSTWQKDLKQIYVKEFKSAVKNRDIVQLTQFFSYFPMISQKETGLTCYSEFINNIVAEQARSLLVGAPRDRIGFYSATIMKLFEISSKIINQHSRVILKYYDNDSMLEIMSKIQREVDAQAGLIADTFWDAREFDKLIHNIENYKFPVLQELATGTSSNSAPSSAGSDHAASDDYIEQLVSVVQVNDYMNEISVFLNRWSLYCQFIATKWMEYAQTSTKSGLQLVPPLKESNFLQKIEQKLCPCLESLTEYYLKKSFEKSFKLEQLPDLKVHILPFVKKTDDTSNEELFKPLEISPISSVVEDLVLILSTVLDVCIKSGQFNLTRSVVVSARRVFLAKFLKIFSRKLKDLTPRSGTNLLAIVNLKERQSSDRKDLDRNVIVGNLASLNNNVNEANTANHEGVLSNVFKNASFAMSNDENKLANFIITLNSVAVMGDYLKKLIHTFNEKVDKSFVFGQESANLKEILEENLDRAVSQARNNVVKDYTQVLFNQIFKSKVRSIINDFFNHSTYFVETSTSDTSLEIKKFTKSWLSLVKPYHKVLSKEIFNTLNNQIVALLVELMEKRVWQLNKKVNLLGVLRLERDVSMVINEVTKYNYTLREKFIRVTQIIMIMGFDDESDEKEFDWVLTNSERKSARNLRIDK